jgi:hypothetical protein
MPNPAEDENFWLNVDMKCGQCSSAFPVRVDFDRPFNRLKLPLQRMVATVCPHCGNRGELQFGLGTGTNPPQVPKQP